MYFTKELSAKLAILAADEGDLNRQIYSVLFLALGLVGIFGNILTIYIMLTEKKLNNIGNIFIINLALVDLCTACFSSCIIAFNLWSEYTLYQDYPITLYLQYIGTNVCVVASITTVMLIGIDR